MTIESSNFSDFYIILSKGYFAPHALEKTAPFQEPFQSSVNAFRDAIVGHRNTDLLQFLSISDSPFWQKKPFIPNIGEISYSHQKNITARLLLGTQREAYGNLNYLRREYPEQSPSEYPTTNRFSYQSSNEILDMLHLPLLIGYQKKIETNPLLSSYIVNSSKNINKKIAVSQQCKARIHFYTYGLCFIHLAISICTPGQISIENILPWVRDLKATSPNRAIRVVIPSGNLSFDSVESFFDYIWGQVSKKVFKDGDAQTLSSPVYDSIRIKPLQRVTEAVVKEFIQTNKNVVITQDDVEAFRTDWYLRFGDEGTTFEELQAALKQARNFSRGNTSQRPELPKFYSETEEIVIRSYYTKMLADATLQQLRKNLPIRLSTKEIAGLLSKSLRWQTYRTTPSEFESVYGKFDGDLILPKSQSLLIVTNIWSRRKQLQLLFQWELNAVSELVYGQKLIISYYLERLEKSRENSYSNNSADILTIGQSALSLLPSLLAVHNHLPSRFRRWYYILAETVGLDRRREELCQYLNLYNLDKKFEDIKKGQIYIYRLLGTQAKHATNLILDGFRQQAVEQGETQRILDAIRRALKHVLNSGVVIKDDELKKALDNIYQSINSNLDFNQQLELSLPIIPFLLEYKVSLNADADLEAVWNQLIRHVKKRQIKNNPSTDNS